MFLRSRRVLSRSSFAQISFQAAQQKWRKGNQYLWLQQTCCLRLCIVKTARFIKAWFIREHKAEQKNEVRAAA